MTRHRKYYFRQSPPSRGATTRVLTNGRLVDASSSGETGSAWHRGRLTLPQVVGITVLALAHFLDYATFLILLSRHQMDAAEANPIVRNIAHQTGLPGLTLAKLMTVVLAASLTIVIWPRYPKLAAVLLTFGVIAGLFGALTNIASL